MPGPWHLPSHQHPQITPPQGLNNPSAHTPFFPGIRMWPDPLVAAASAPGRAEGLPRVARHSEPTSQHLSTRVSPSCPPLSPEYLTQWLYGKGRSEWHRCVTYSWLPAHTDGLAAQVSTSALTLHTHLMNSRAGLLSGK